MRDYKVVVLGAGGVGKSSLTVQFVQGVYIDTYDPTIEDSYRKQVEVDGRACDLEILDTAGVAQFTAMRELYIKSGKGFLLVYSVTDKSSLDELLALREQVLRIKDSTNVPMVLVGNKCDLVEDRELQPADGIKVSEGWGRVPFYETSAMHRTNVDEVFIDVVRQIMREESLEANTANASTANGETATNTAVGTSGVISSATVASATPAVQQRHGGNIGTGNGSGTAAGASQKTARPLGKVASRTGIQQAKTKKQKQKKKKKSSCIIL